MTPACPTVAALVYGMVCATTVTRVIDGDSAIMRFGTETHAVRVVGIDTPERGEPGWAEATEAARSVYEGHTATLRIGGAASRTSAATGRRCVGEAVRDRYGRVLASVDGWKAAVGDLAGEPWCR